MVLTKDDIQIISDLINNALKPLREDISSLKEEVKALRKDHIDLKHSIAKLTDRVSAILSLY